jgi:hypothetical protein
MSRWLFWAAILVAILVALWLNFTHAAEVFGLIGLPGNQPWIAALAPELLIVVATMELVRLRNEGFAEKALAGVLLGFGLVTSLGINLTLASEHLPPDAAPWFVAWSMFLWGLPTAVNGLIWPLADQRVRSAALATVAVTVGRGNPARHVGQPRPSSTQRHQPARIVVPSAAPVDPEPAAVVPPPAGVGVPPSAPAAGIPAVNATGWTPDKPWPKGPEGRKIGVRWALAFEAENGRLPTQGEMADVSGWPAAQQCKLVLRAIRTERGITPDQAAEG